LEKVNMPLASPSVAHATGNWTRTFFQEADKKCLRMEYTAVHWYGGANAQSFKQTMIEAYEDYGKRPLLITEFAVADWDAEEPRENKVRCDKNILFD
jgi:O-glycosyl hydrolase